MRFFPSLAIVALISLATAVAGCGRGRATIPPTAAIIVPGRPPEIAERATRALRPLIAERTEIVRVDRANEVLLRCSFRARDDSVRLVEISLRAAGENADATSVAVVSRAFSFVMKPARDALDAETEAQVLAAVRAADPSIPPPPQRATTQT